MKKIAFVRRYGRNWEVSMHLVEDRVAEKALRLSRARMWDLAYKMVVQNDLATNSQKAKKDWSNLDSVDILLAYFRGRSF